MASKELRKLKRMELLDIIYSLQENEEKLKEEKAELERKLEERVIKKESVGSIAEAALSLNDVFESAQAAAEQYLESVHDVHKEALEKAGDIISNAKIKADAIIAEAEEEAKRIKNCES